MGLRSMDYREEHTVPVQVRKQILFTLVGGKLNEYITHF